MMNLLREEFERKHPVPEGVYWHTNGHHYDSLSGWVGNDALEAYQTKWEAWLVMQGGSDLGPDVSRLVRALERLIAAMEDYEMDVDDSPPHHHRSMMQDARAALSAYRSQKVSKMYQLAHLPRVGDKP